MTIKLFLITGPCKGLHSSKLNSANYYKIQKTALKGLFCSSQSNPAPAILCGQRVHCFEVTAGSCCSLLHTTLFSTSLLCKEQNLSQCSGKQNYVTENEKNSDYYYLRNRKMIEVVFSSQVSLLAFYFRENFKHKSLFSLMHYNIIMGL